MAPFDNRDPAWISKGLLGRLKHTLDVGRFTWLEPPEQPTKVPNDCRIAILGDWASGRYGAPVCASSIANDPAGFDVVLHLGDVYYAGRAEEIQHNFLHHWPFDAVARTPNRATPLFRACLGNHEMYSGGQPFVDLVLEPFEQQSTAFAFENDDWLFVGLDTAYDEWRLGARQENWLRRLLARDDGRQVVLFSHHPPFSFFESINSKYYESMRDVLIDHPDKVRAWYWGHEHLGAIYDLCPRLGLRGRCVGHSGFPYIRRNDVRGATRVTTMTSQSEGCHLVQLQGDGRAPTALAVDGPNLHIDPADGDPSRYGPNGYMTIEFNGRLVEERLCAPAGEVLWSGRLHHGNSFAEEFSNSMYQERGSVLSYA